MGKIKGSQFIKKSKELSFYLLRGEIIVKTKTKNVYNPRTPAQQLGRSKFGLVAHLGSKVKHTLIHPYWNPIAKKDKKIGYNLFLSTNTLALQNGNCSLKNLKLCPDNGLNQEEFTVALNENRVQISWDSTLTDHRKNDQDQFCLLSLTEELDFEFIITKTIRKDDFFEFQVNPDIEKYYFAFWRNGGRWSESRLLVENLM